MKRGLSKPPAATVRQWRVFIIRHRMESLGRVAAADRDAAEAVAMRSSSSATRSANVLIEEVRYRSGARLRPTAMLPRSR
jgi:hypothetical protein